MTHATEINAGYGVPSTFNVPVSAARAPQIEQDIEVAAVTEGRAHQIMSQLRYPVDDSLKVNLEKIALPFTNAKGKLPAFLEADFQRKLRGKSQATPSEILQAILGYSYNEPDNVSSFKWNLESAITTQASGDTVSSYSLESARKNWHKNAELSAQYFPGGEQGFNDFIDALTRIEPEANAIGKKIIHSIEMAEFVSKEGKTDRDIARYTEAARKKWSQFPELAETGFPGGRAAFEARLKPLESDADVIADDLLNRLEELEKPLVEAKTIDFLSKRNNDDEIKKIKSAIEIVSHKLTDLVPEKLQKINSAIEAIEGVVDAKQNHLFWPTELEGTQRRLVKNPRPIDHLKTWCDHYSSDWSKKSYVKSTSTSRYRWYSSDVIPFRSHYNNNIKQLAEDVLTLSQDSSASLKHKAALYRLAGELLSDKSYADMHTEIIKARHVLIDALQGNTVLDELQNIFQDQLDTLSYESRSHRSREAAFFATVLDAIFQSHAVHTQMDSYSGRKLALSVLDRLAAACINKGGSSSSNKKALIQSVTAALRHTTFQTWPLERHDRGRVLRNAKFMKQLFQRKGKVSVSDLPENKKWSISGAATIRTLLDYLNGGGKVRAVPKKETFHRNTSVNTNQSNRRSELDDDLDFFYWCYGAGDDTNSPRTDLAPGLNGSEGGGHYGFSDDRSPLPSFPDFLEHHYDTHADTGFGGVGSSGGGLGGGWGSGWDGDTGGGYGGGDSGGGGGGGDD